MLLLSILRFFVTPLFMAAIALRYAMLSLFTYYRFFMLLFTGYAAIDVAAII